MGTLLGPHGCPPKGKGNVYDGRASHGSAGVPGRPVTGRALTSASSLHCGSEGNSSFTSSMVPGPRRVGAARGTAVRPAGPRAGGGDAGRRAGGRRADARRAHSEHSRTTVSGRLQQEGRGQGDALPAAMLRPSPSAGLRAPQTAGIRPRHEPITVSSRPHPRATANPSPRSPTARPRRRQVSACLRPARPRARRRGGRGLLRGGAGPQPEEERGGPGRRPSAVRPARLTFPEEHSEGRLPAQFVREVITHTGRVQFKSMLDYAENEISISLKQFKGNSGV